MIKQERLSLADLAKKVSELLRENGLLDAQQDARVSPVPDARTVRYYTTIGLLDRPDIEGRQGYYGRRHVLQLLAIKALQGNQLPLYDIQTRLYGKTERELESIIATLSQGKKRRAEVNRPIVWREVTIEPGLKLLAEENWSPASTQSLLEERLKDAMNVLNESNANRRNEQ